MFRYLPQGRVARPCAAFFVLFTSCSLLSGCANIFGLTPSGNRLIPQAKALRSAYPEPLPLPRELEKRIASPYIVEPGDVLLVQPAALDSPVHLPGDQTVLPDGTIQLGRYGQIVVAGKTVPQIETDVRAQIEAQTKDAGPIAVRLVTRVSKVYYVLGEVNAPGAFPLQGRETVLDAILAAGGLNDKASRKFITLSRPTHPDGCRVVLPVCYNEIVQLGDTSTNYQIAAGDRIYVPTRGHDDCGRKKVCLPCGRPQTPCPAPAGCIGAPGGLPGPVPDGIPPSGAFTPFQPPHGSTLNSVPTMSLPAPAPDTPATPSTRNKTTP
ncbi:MAG TPA: polysaccharide biosynthesis/export family protein [Gemmataceae bacterium]|nr:polysaccharide biosynthesis/export family protein [Gemmataceae bacterium]